jgi:CheY-like chemotaxis protein
VDSAPGRDARTSLIFDTIPTSARSSPETGVAMTAHAMTGDRDRCLEAGMDEYVTEPISFREVDRILQQVVQGLAA